MRKLIILFFTAFIVTATESQVYFTSEPALSPDGSKIVFAYDNDLWIVPSAGGTAYRVTGMQGRESEPRFSPDGKWLAFTGRQDGNSDIFVMPVNGGKVTQLTFSDASDVVSSWSWDSKTIYFTSNRFNRMNTYAVSITGGTPEQVFPGYFTWVHNFVINPATGNYLFNESWESSYFANRKRYKGAFNPDIKSYNPKTGEFKKLTDWIGKDMWPTVDKNGHIYFVSDEANSEYNLYTFINGKKTQLTDFDLSVKTPQVSADGNYVVFDKGFQIFLYNVASKKSSKVDIQLPENNTLSTENDFNVKGKITAFAVSPDQKKLAFVSRGELFVSDIKGKFVKQLKSNTDGRVKEVGWVDSADVIFNQTVGGWLNWFVIPADGNGSEKQITNEQRNDRQITFSADGSKALYLSGRDQLRELDLKTEKSETLITDEFWAVSSADPYFSPDGKYIVYNAYRNFETDIFVYNTRTKKSVNITNSGVSEGDPFWSPDGKYIYFESDRLHPAYPYGYENAEIYRIALQDFDKEFKSSEFDKLFAKAEKDKKEKEKKAADVKIDFKDMRNRWEEVTSAKGDQVIPYVITDKEETRVLYLSDQDGKDSYIWQTIYKPFEKPETKKIEGAKANGMNISKGKDKYYVLVGGNINELDLKDSKLNKIDVDFTFQKNLKNEFKEMYYEVWANLDENYYDDNFHGVNWEKMRDKYAEFLPYITSRENLRTLLTDLQGELNSSHQGFYTTGKEEETFYTQKSAVTGIIFSNTNPYEVDYVVKKSPADKEGKEIEKGDMLTAVNGINVDPSMNRESYFDFPKEPEEISLTFKRNDESREVKIHPESTAKLRDQLYDMWIAANRKYVHDKSDGQIAYVYMKNMGTGALDKFIIDMTTEDMNKKGLILDIRYNTGGNVHDKVLQFLSQRPYLKWKYRDGKFTIQPNFTPSAKPIVLLVNFQTLSDGEMTTEGFKALGLGKIIGTETYRWIIFTTGKSLVDGSFYRLPSWGCYTLDGKDLEHNGVKPDIYVETNFKDRIENKDPQLDRAIDEVKAEMK